MLSKNVEKALNDQINKEFLSAYLYLSMSIFFHSKNLKGFSHWMKIQSKEELSHAIKFIDYINERNGSVALMTLRSPKYKWTNSIEVFQNVYEHEKEITKSINILFALTEREKDYASSVFLNWFIQEQIEEESKSLEILNKLKLIKNDLSAMFILDKELSTRALEKK